MRPAVPISLAAAVGFLTAAAAQTPPEKLPNSITGATPPAVVPVAATAPATKEAPIARFQNLGLLPPETAQAVVGMRTGAAWLNRMHQPNGRFLHGLNPAVRMPLDGDNDFRQALAAFATCQAARFTGDAQLTATAGQAVLSLLTLTRDDSADPTCRVPMTPVGVNKVGFAAALSLAVYELPSADPQRIAEADKLCVFLRKQVQSDGSIRCADGVADADCANLYPGLVLQALAACNRMKPDPARAALVAKSLAFYRAAFRAKPHPVLAGTVIPAAVELFLQAPDKDAAATAFEMADWLCLSQYGKNDVRQLTWAGGFRTTADAAGEPGHDSAVVARGLAAATHLTRQLADGARYSKYRPALIDALAFVHGLQFSPDNTDHFEGKFRGHYLIGGVHLAPGDGTLRIDATAAGVSAFLRFLESGAENRE
jgi:hypothetical protein